MVAVDAVASARRFAPRSLLVIHGTDDDVVPIEQSRAMKKALDGAGMPTDLIELEGEGHSYWESENEMRVLAAIDAFLWKHIGAGYGVTTPPAPYEARNQ